MQEIDKILIKLQHKAKKEALKELINEFKDNPKIANKLKKMLDKEPSNI